MEHDRKTNLQFRVLGQIEVVKEGKEGLDLGPKQVALLALLLMHPHEVSAQTTFWKLSGHQAMGTRRDELSGFMSPS